MSRAAAVLTLSLFAVAAACSAKTDDPRNGAPSPPVGTTEAGADSNAASVAFTAERFATAAGCTGCTLLHSTRLLLPETGIVASSAKLSAADGTLRAVTIDDAGAVLDEATLVANERAAVRAKYGKLRPELSAWVAGAAPTDRRWVWIWTDVSVTHPRREELTAASAATSFRTQVANALDISVKPVRDFAAKLSGIEFGDASGPMLRARLTAAQVQQVAELAHVAQVGVDIYPGTLRAGSFPDGALAEKIDGCSASHFRGSA